MNPFVYNSPVRGKDFFNREETIQKIIKETVTGKSQGSIWITGERQIGKTSLLRHIQSKNEHFTEKVVPYGTDKTLDMAFVFANVQGCTTENEFFHLLWQGLKDYFNFKLRKTKNAYNDFIKALTEVYSKQKHYTVFLIDEFDAFIETLSYEDPKIATAFLAKLSSLLQEVDEIDEGTKTFGCVFTANHDIRELLNQNHVDIRGSGLVVEALNLRWFTKFKVKQLAVSYLKDNEISFTDKELEICYKHTQGYPYFTQKMLSLMYDTKKQGLNERQFKKKIKQDYGEVFKETIEDWGGDRIPIRTLKKLRDMVKQIDIGRHLSNVIFKTLELYIRSKIM